MFVWASAIAVSSYAADKQSPSCWVEFRSSRPYEELARSGVRFKSAQKFDRYAVLINPSVPDYRYGASVDKNLVFQFMASCEDSREAIAVLVDEPLKKKLASHGISMIVRPPTPHDLRTATFYMERPKYWLRDCIVAIKYIPSVKEKDQDSWTLPPFLVEFTINRQDVFAPNNAGFDYAHSRIYIDFWRSCDRRVEMAKAFIAAYQEKHDDGRHYRVMKRKFDPYAMKSRSAGPTWLDHYFPEGPPKK